MAKVDARRRRLLRNAGIGAVGLAGLAAVTAGGGWAAGTGSRSDSAALQAFRGRAPWLNTSPLQSGDLAGKVMLVNFWTYSCINSLRTLPYLRAWARKYQERGLVVIGVHAPEFGFEHDIDNVRRALADLGVTYPNVLDNEFSIWTAYGNEAWPGFFFVDRRGRVRHRTYGEERYAQSERWIQELLAEDGRPIDAACVEAVGEGAQAAPDWADLQSPETYVGYAKASNFASWSGLQRNTLAAYEPSSQLALNHWSLSGSWRVDEEYATAAASGASIRFSFHARDLHFVLGRTPRTGAIRYRIQLDGQAPGVNHGVDCDADGVGVLDQDRMYQLVRQRGGVSTRTFEITFLDAGARAYVFTFG